MKRILIGVSLLAWVFLGWSIGIEPGLLTAREIELDAPGWPDSRPPLRIAFASDFHVGALHWPNDRLGEIVARINAWQPDLIVLGGDFLTGGRLAEDANPADIARGLSGLQAKLGVFSVLGNHDWWENGDGMWAALEANGITVLENRAISIDTPHGRMWLAGLADDSTRMARPDMVDEIDAGDPVLALMHDPGTFFDLSARPFLSLAGHTHGGQIFLPFYGAPVVPGRAPRSYAYGLFTLADGRALYVTSGIGTSIMPIRFNMPPEVVLLSVK